MDERLPKDLQDLIEYQLTFRQAQLAQLRLLYHDQCPSPPLLVIHGPKETYKSETLRYHLDEEDLDYAFVDCTECLSQRHLLARIFAQCVRKLDKQDELERYDRVDSINALYFNLRRLLDGRRRRFLLVLVGIDEQKSASHTLLPALARLGERMPCLCIILTSSSPRPLPLHKTGIPYIHFPAYSRSELIRLVIEQGPPPVPDPPVYNLPGPELGRPTSQSLEQIYKQFATTIYDTLIAPTTSSLAIFQRTCHRLWPRFIWPLLINAPTKETSNKAHWDFAKLLSRNRALFQADGEAALQDCLVEDEKHAWTFENVARRYIEEEEQLKAHSAASQQPTPATGLDMTLTPSRRLRLEAAQKQQEEQKRKREEESTATLPLLKFIPTLTLLAAYLASHTPSKHDIILFSRLSTASSTSRRKRRYLNKSRAGGISRTPTQSPRKRKNAANDNSDDDNDEQDFNPSTPSKKRLTTAELGVTSETPTTPKKERADRSMRAILEKTSSIARPFPLERLLAILRAIHPHALPNSKPTADRIYTALAELERLRLVVRVNSARERVGEIRRSTGTSRVEELMEEKWRCGVSREFVVGVSREWGLSLDGWEIE